MSVCTARTANVLFNLPNMAKIIFVDNLVLQSLHGLYLEVCIKWKQNNELSCTDKKYQHMYTKAKSQQQTDACNLLPFMK